MQDNITNKPSVVIDFPNNLIRIHKKTIISIGSPENILLIINPDKLTFGIVGCTKGIHGSHRIHYKRTHCYELYSKAFINALKMSFPYWDDTKSYRMTGDYIYKERIARFNLANSVLLKSKEVEF